MVCIYTCKSMILATKIIKIGQLGPKSWPFFISRLLAKFSHWVFHSFCHFRPHRQCQNTSGHQGMHLHMRKHNFSHKNHQNWSIRVEIMANFQIKSTRNILNLKIGHYFSPNGPILMIFVAKIMLSHVQMHTMMTRSFVALPIRVQMAKSMKNPGQVFFQ